MGRVIIADQTSVFHADVTLTDEAALGDSGAAASPEAPLTASDDGTLTESADIVVGGQTEPWKEWPMDVFGADGTVLGQSVFNSPEWNCQSTAALTSAGFAIEQAGSNRLVDKTSAGEGADFIEVEADAPSGITTFADVAITKSVRINYPNLSTGNPYGLTPPSAASEYYLGLTRTFGVTGVTEICVEGWVKTSSDYDYDYPGADPDHKVFLSYHGAQRFQIKWRKRSGKMAWGLGTNNNDDQYSDGTFPNNEVAAFASDQFTNVWFRYRWYYNLGTAPNYTDSTMRLYVERDPTGAPGVFTRIFSGTWSANKSGSIGYFTNFKMSVNRRTVASDEMQLYISRHRFYATVAQGGNGLPAWATWGAGTTSD